VHQVLLVPGEDQQPEWVSLTDVTSEIRRLLGDTFEMVTLTDTLIVLALAHGKRLGHDRNQEAAALAERLSPGFHRHSIIYGPAVFATMAEDGDIVGISSKDREQLGMPASSAD